MNAIVRKLKLYRISTVLNYCRNSWDNSAFVIKQCPSKSRFSVFVDLLYWYIFYGEFYQFNLSSCIRQQNSLTAQFVSFSLANLANIFYPPPPIFTIINLCLL